MRRLAHERAFTTAAVLTLALAKGTEKSGAEVTSLLLCLKNKLLRLKSAFYILKIVLSVI
jgi:hypothetical protein